MKNRIINILILIFVLAVQVFCFAVIYFGSRGLHGNISLDLGGVMLFIFVPTLVHYRNVVRFIVPISLWSAGFYVVFQHGINAIAGAMLIIASALLEYKVKGEDERRS